MYPLLKPKCIYELVSTVHRYLKFAPIMILKYWFLIDILSNTRKIYKMLQIKYDILKYAFLFQIIKYDLPFSKIILVILKLHLIFYNTK